ncbi:hypothetical protein MSAR_08950 [Mycolicibacterium sarraceniae]|uniref:Uncharacterized protein n=2 Tax=Mycolicibacterium sarraceniae TaxID=1534348 RepID=A0A7I7SNF2_9MYCO|nr:hypothetical protein MSAR_08950 [Mycolicibacterium sarraceniae]
MIESFEVSQAFMKEVSQAFMKEVSQAFMKEGIESFVVASSAAVRWSLESSTIA